MNPKKIEITVGIEAKDYKLGNFLNAVDELTCFFLYSDGMQDLANYAKALRLYADSLED